MSRILKSALVAALLTACPAAFAEKPVVIVAKPAMAYAVVTYGDLDLSRQTGVETLLKRLSGATKKVCGGTHPMFHRWGAVDRYLTCRDEAMSGAVRQIDNPAVTLAFEATTGARGTQLASR